MMPELSCDEIVGRAFRPLFERSLSDEDFAALLPEAGRAPVYDVQRRPARGHLVLDWRSRGDVQYSAGLQDTRLIFVSLRFAPGQLAARQLIACLGEPGWYQAWSDVWPQSNMRSVQVALLFPGERLIAYCAEHLTGSLDEAHRVTADISAGHLSIFGPSWAEDPRALANAHPWPGDWADLAIPVTRHSEAPLPDEADVVDDDEEPPAIPEVLAQIAAAFADVPRPADDELLHPDVHDDSDIQALLGVPRWQDLPEASVEGEYSALSFLGPAAYRHFLPAYLSWVLRHPESGAAVVSSTIFGLAPVGEEPLRSFMISKFSMLDRAQREAVLAFLKAMAPHEDVAAALFYWRGRTG